MKLTKQYLKMLWSVFVSRRLLAFEHMFLLFSRFYF